MRRKTEELTKLNQSPVVARSVAVNHALKEQAKYPSQNVFLPQNWFPWLASYLKYAFTPRYSFQEYRDRTGVYQVEPLPGSASVKIAIAGDWATGTQEAEAIAGLMFATGPDLTIHLGDIYYVGDASEVAENCFGEFGHGFDGVTWPHGTQGSFALNGNHEMYANGRPYFTTFLSSLGIKGQPGGQVASFFAIEAGSWRIIGLDTGYNSVGIPILSMIPGIKSIPGVGGDCHLPKALIEWLRNVVRPKENPKPTVLLSHHEYFTAFPDRFYTKPAKQLMEFFDTQETVWLWGHEHRMGVYGKFSTDGGITTYGRCVGHGGMPVDLGTPDPSKAPLQFWDSRSHKLSNGVLVGENGFVNLIIEGDALTLDYRDIRNEQIFLETFSPASGGKLLNSSP